MKKSRCIAAIRSKSKPIWKLLFAYKLKEMK